MRARRVASPRQQSQVANARKIAGCYSVPWPLPFLSAAVTDTATAAGVTPAPGRIHAPPAALASSSRVPTRRPVAPLRRALSRDAVFACAFAAVLAACWPSAATAVAAVTVTATAGPADCIAVAKCRADANCSACLDAITPYLAGGATIADVDRVEAVFFQTLLATPACAVDATPPDRLNNVLGEVSDAYPGACKGEAPAFVNNCQGYEYVCFSQPECGACLAALRAPGADKAAALNTTSCRTAVVTDTWATLSSNCDLPACTSAKLACGRSDECARCWATLRGGDGAAAASQCPPGSCAAKTLDALADSCSQVNVGCSFFLRRCEQDPGCAECVGAINNNDGAGGDAALERIAEGPGCSAVRENATAQARFIYVLDSCLSLSGCDSARLECTLQEPLCGQCLTNSTAAAAHVSECNGVLATFSVSAECAPCPASLGVLNRVVLVTSVVGGLSTLACVGAVASIFALGRHRVAARDRVVAGMLLANAVYSSANTVPLNLLHTSHSSCGMFALPIRVIQFWRGWWFAGKYALVAFEMVMLGTSTWALQIRGDASISRGVEMALHCACAAAGVAAFAVFYGLASAIISSGYNEDSEHMSEVGGFSFSHYYASDDFDDDGHTESERATERFTSGRDEYNALVQRMLEAWLGFLGVAVLQWIYLRWQHVQAARLWRLHADEVAAQHRANEAWALTLQSEWRADRRHLEDQRDGYSEVAAPLEPYVLVFLLFGAPAVVMATDFCSSRSSANTASGGDFFGAAVPISYGECDVWCEFVLAFRSAATVALYVVLLPRKHRRRCLRAVCSCFRSKPRHGRRRAGASVYEDADGDSDDDDDAALIDEVALEPVGGARNGSPAQAPSDDATWRIGEADVTTDRLLGKGAFGEVWAGRLDPGGRPVAVKVLQLAGAVDEDGDPIDPNADEEFKKECAALRRISHPNLLVFVGFGTNKDGHSFIVTELMLGGSLESVLHDSERELPWRTRVSIGLQVALGMAHLHSLHMLHRDLKSANVLVDKDIRIAKVCDFGLARIVSPAQRDVVHSSFTGTTRLLPAGAGDAVGGGARVGVAGAAVDAECAGAHAMTKAAGTLPWMAPEVFRGSARYGKAVDVFSFGVVLWELATRQTPWRELECGDVGEVAFFKQLSQALQMGRRPRLPDSVTAEHASFVVVMRRCWASDPADRPQFSEAASELSACLRAEALR